MPSTDERPIERCDPATRFLMASLAATAPSRPRAFAALSDRDWAQVDTIADRHGVAAIVVDLLAADGSVPAAPRDALRARAQAQAARALQGVVELIRVTSALDDAGIQTVSLKGPLFSQWLYGAPGRRRFADLDILVTPNDRDRAFAVLNGLGYELPTGMSPRAAGVIYRALGAWPLVRPGVLPIDLHWRLAHARFAAPLTPSQVFAESSTVEIGGASIRTPSATHVALLTLLHAAKHVWCTLEQVAAIAALMRRPDVDWTAVRALAHRASAWNACATGLRLACEILGASRPPASGNDWPAATDRLCREAHAALAKPAGQLPDRWDERRVHRASFDRWRERVLYDVSRTLAPTAAEWQWWPLPDALVRLYGPLRVMRLGAAALRGRVDADASHHTRYPHSRTQGRGHDRSQGEHESHVQGCH